MAIIQWTWVGWYQNVSTLDITGAKDDTGGGNNWSYKKCKASVKSSSTSNPILSFFTARMTFLSHVQQCQITKGKKNKKLCNCIMFAVSFAMCTMLQRSIRKLDSIGREASHYSTVNDWIKDNEKNASSHSTVLTSQD